MSYIIYVKNSSMKRWAPLGHDRPVVNLFHAIMYGTRKAAQYDMDGLVEANPDAQFQIRRKG